MVLLDAKGVFLFSNFLNPSWFPCESGEPEDDAFGKDGPRLRVSPHRSSFPIQIDGRMSLRADGGAPLPRTPFILGRNLVHPSLAFMRPEGDASGRRRGELLVSAKRPNYARALFIQYKYST